MLRAFYTACVLLIAYNIQAQTNSRGDIKGTVIIAVIGKDGIVIAADSRGAIAGNSEQDILGYMDSLPKFILINGFPLAFAGSATAGEKSITALADSFNRIEPKSKNID